MPGFSFGKPKCAWCLRHEAAQRGELPDDAPLPVMPVPWARPGLGSASLTHVLVGINALIFGAMVLSGMSFMDPSQQDLVRWGSNYGPLTYGGQWWRLITYNFLHGGILHIGFNMWCLWDLGALAESLYGTWTFGALYMISGVAGGLMSTGLSPGRSSVGASAAIFGLAGALIASYYLGEFNIPRPMIRMQLRSLLVFVGFNIIFGSVSGRTDNAAHFGGLIAGLACGALIAKLAPSSENFTGRAAILGLMVLIVGGTTFALTRSRGYLIHMSRGEQLLRQEQTDAAISEFKAAVSMNSRALEPHLGLANAYYSSKQLPQAEAELKKALAIDPASDDANDFMGFVYLAEKRAAEAQPIFSKLIAKDDKLAPAYYGLGRALSDQGKDDAAIEEYKKTIALSPEFPGVYYRLGVSQSNLKLYDAAIASFLNELRFGEDHDTEIALAQAYQAKGQADKAAEAMQRAEKSK